jgi:hypothetical protein
VLEHLAEVVAVDPAAAGRATEKMLTRSWADCLLIGKPAARSASAETLGQAPLIAAE